MAAEKDLKIADGGGKKKKMIIIAAAVVVPTALLEHDDLFAARLGDDFGRNDEAIGALHFAAVTGQQDVAQRHGVASFAVDLFNGDLVSGGDAILLAARAHDCEHGLPSNQKTKLPAHQSPTKAGDFSDMRESQRH